MSRTTFIMRKFLFLNIVISSAFATPDSAYINGNVITVDEEFSIAQAFSVKGGKFHAVGTSDEIASMATPSTQIIDLRGMTVIPGLIDNHNHFIRGATHWTSILRLDGVNSRKQALSMLREHTNQLPPKEWIYVLGGWNEEQFSDDPRGFTLAELDEITDDRPAFIQAQYDHAFVNSAFLHKIGVDTSQPLKSSSSTDNPSIEKIIGPPLAELVVRDSKGFATSRLEGGMGMVLQVSTIMPRIDQSELADGIRSAQLHYNSLGLTSVYDPGGALVSQDTIKAIEALHDTDALTLRVYRTKLLSHVSSDAISGVMKLRALPAWLSGLVLGFVNDVEGTSDEIEVVKGLPIESYGDDFYDQLAVGEVIYVPMHDSLEHQHYEITPERLSELKNLIEAILQRGLSLHIHAVTEATIEAYLDIMESLSTKYPLRPNQIEFSHGEGVNLAQLQRIKNLNIGLQVRSMSVVRSRKSLLSDYGDSAVSMPPLRSIQDSGVLWGLGTDGTKASQINPMITLYWAISGFSINGDRVLDRSHTISRKEALIAHTRSNAALVNRATTLGQIKEGYLADFVVLDRDYMTVPTSEIKDIKIHKTVVDGKQVYPNNEKL